MAYLPIIEQMLFEELSQIIFVNLKLKLEKHRGLSFFAEERAKFEGWLKVELCDILSNYFSKITPEKNRVDLSFDNWEIELKTLNTNIRYESVLKKHRPITKNTQGVIDDINKLRKNQSGANKGVLFIVFPIEHGNKKWQTQLERIEKYLTKLNYIEFSFEQKPSSKGKTPGVIYFGLV